MYSGLEIATVYGRRYPAAIIRPAPNWQYPFGSICRLMDVNMPTLVEDREQKNYLKLLGRSLKWPKMSGFALRRILCDDRGRAEAIEAVVTNFRQNVVTSHILEWELYQFYTSNRTNQSSPTASGVAGILERLPRRAAYHAERPARLCSARACIRVSADQSTGYGRVSRLRDGSVSQPGELLLRGVRRRLWSSQAISNFNRQGALGLHGTDDDSDESLVLEGFDVRMAALFREYAEELFDAKHLQVRPDGRDAKSVLADPNVRQLVDLIKDGKASIDYLGIVIDLSVLRHELSFLIIIDDESFCRNPLLGSWEAKNIQTPKPSELLSVLATGVLHGSSAALLQLAMESEHLRNLGISMDLVRSAK